MGGNIRRAGRPAAVRLPAPITLPPVRLSPRAGMLVCVVLWAGNFTASKLAFREFDPYVFTAIRFVLGSALLAGLAWADPDFRRPPAGARWRLVLLGLTANTLYQLCFLNGLARTSATNSALILASMPAAVTFAAGATGIEVVTGRQRAATLLATAGVVLVLAGRGLTFGGEHVGDLLMLGAVVMWAAYTLLVRRYGLRMSSLALTAWTTILGTPGLVLAAVPAFRAHGWPHVSSVAWAGFFYATLLSLIAAYLLWNQAVRAIGASRAAVYTCLTPLIAAGIAAVALHERPTLFHAAGAALIVLGVYWSQRAPAPAPATTA